MRVRLAVAVALAVLASTGRPSSQSPTVSAARVVPGEILVQFKPGTAASARADAHRQAAGTRLGGIDRTGVERVRVAAGRESASLTRYLQNPNVVQAELHHVRFLPKPLSHGDGVMLLPGDYHFNEQVGFHNTGQGVLCFMPDWCLIQGTPDADIDAPEAWAMSTGSATVAVAVIDSGIDYLHPDLAPNYAGGYDFVSDDADPMDDHGHGTHVAGTVAAAMSNLTGELPPEGEEGPLPAEEGVVGVAPNARILAYKVCGADGSCTDFAIQQAISAAIDAGARVINMSLGDVEYSATLNTAVQDAWAAGLVIVAGAGNNGNTTPFYPAALANVVSVAAYDEFHARASFSTYGSWVDLSAPGNNVLSTYPTAACGGLGTVPGDMGCYTWNSGTSMASPHVAGAAAMVWSRSGVSTNSQVVDILLQSTDHVGVFSLRLDSWTKYGGLNLHGAMSFAATNAPPIARAGSDQTVTDTDGSGGEVVGLDGRGSTDADGTISSYQWREGANVLATGATANVALAVGSHTLTLVVTDDDGATGSDQVLIVVQPRPVSTDTVAILKAAYTSRKGQLSIEATSSSQPNVTLTAYDTTNTQAVLIGQLFWDKRRARYTGTYTRPKPASVRVSSSGGGSATSTVSSK